MSVFNGLGDIQSYGINIFFPVLYVRIQKNSTFDPGEMAEWSIAAVLKTVEG